MLMIEKIDLYSDGIGRVEYVDHMGDDLRIVNAARVSFGVEKLELDKRDKKLIDYLISHKHTSTLEHNLVTFKFIVPLFIRSQHHRHRTWSYNEISRRYTDVDLRFYEPDEFRTQHESNRQASNVESTNPELDVNVGMGDYPGRYFGKSSLIINRWHKDSLRLYDALLESGVCREQARGVLPQNLYTEYYGTVNLNNLMKFISLRMHDGAQWEIQQVANACLTIAKGLWPYAVSSYDKNKSV
jgi:thymidylate synthase (FAD)